MTNDRFTEIKENINEALGVEYRYWDDHDNARDDMLWLLGEVARLRDNYAIFEEMAPPDLPRDMFARGCFAAWEGMDAKNHRIEQLESEAKRLKEIEQGYRSTLSLIGDICRSYAPLPAVISIRTIAEAALTVKEPQP